MEGVILIMKNDAATRKLMATSPGTASDRDRTCCERDVAGERMPAREGIPDVVPLAQKKPATAFEGVMHGRIVEAFDVALWLARSETLVQRRTHADRMPSRGRPVDEVWSDTQPLIRSVDGHCHPLIDDLAMCIDGADGAVADAAEGVLSRTALAWGRGRASLWNSLECRSWWREFLALFGTHPFAGKET